MPPAITARRLTSLVGPLPGARPAYQEVAGVLRLLIADGQVTSGTRLPSERSLVDALGLSRTTVTRAYAVLREAGFVTSRQGSGTVAALPSGTGRRHEQALTPGDEGLAPETINLTCASLPAAPGLAAAHEQAVAELPTFLGTDGYHPLGLLGLRERIAERYTQRGLPTTVEQVMVTSGAVAGLAIVARAFIGAGDRAMMENPTYPNAVTALQRVGARLVAAPLDPRGGWDVEGMEATLAQTAPRLAFLMPDFHNPTGALMDEDVRRRLGAALTASRTLAVVDETMAELPHDPGAPVPRPLAAFASHSVSLGSASKSHWGGLRIGWIRAPRTLMPALTQARLTLDLGSPVLEQLVLQHLLPDIETTRAARAQVLREGRSALLDALADLLPGWHPLPGDGGLSAWVALPRPISTAVTVTAERHGLLLAPGPQFSVDGGMERHIRLPFTRPPDVIRQAVERLALADAEVTPGVRGRDERLPGLIA